MNDVKNHRVNAVIVNVKQFATIETLGQELLNILIDRIEVNEKEQIEYDRTIKNISDIR